MTSNTKNNKNHLAGALAFFICSSLPAQAQHMQTGEGDHLPMMMTPAPIGVGAAGVAPKGKLMMSYKYMNMDMGTLLDRDEETTADTIAATTNYRGIPLQMTGQMHMFGGMYGVTDRLALMAMVPWVHKEMTMATYNMMGTAKVGEITNSSKGIGDIKIGGLYALTKSPFYSLHTGLSVSLPTGSIEEDITALMPNGMTRDKRGGYSMQLGSGTYDLLPSITAKGQNGAVSWGVQYSAVLRLENENKADYRRGHIHKATAWVGYKWAPWISTSARLEGSSEGQIKGADPLIAGRGIGADPDNFGGKRLEAYLGANFTGTTGMLKGTRLGIEYGIPLYEKLNGTRLGVDHIVKIGLTKKF